MTIEYLDRPPAGWFLRDELQAELPSLCVLSGFVRHYFSPAMWRYPWLRLLLPLCSDPIRWRSALDPAAPPIATFSGLPYRYTRCRREHQRYERLCPRSRFVR